MRLPAQTKQTTVPLQFIHQETQLSDDQFIFSSKSFLFQKKSMLSACFQACFSLKFSLARLFRAESLPDGRNQVDINEHTVGGRLPQPTLRSGKRTAEGGGSVWALDLSEAC